MTTSRIAFARRSIETSRRARFPVLHDTTSSFSSFDHPLDSSLPHVPQSGSSPMITNTMSREIAVEPQCLSSPQYGSISPLYIGWKDHVSCGLEESPTKSAYNNDLLNLFPGTPMEELSPAFEPSLLSIETQTNVHPAAYEIVREEHWNSAYIGDNMATSPEMTKSYGSTPCTPNSIHDSVSPNLVQHMKGATDTLTSGLKVFAHSTDACLPPMSHLTTQYNQQRATTRHDSLAPQHETSMYALQPRGLPLEPYNDHHSLTQGKLSEDISVEDESLSPEFTPSYDPSIDDDISQNSGDDDDDVKVDIVSTSQHSALLSRAQGDDFIVHLRNQGVSYQEIQRRGGYTQAISTLRGRYRNATKAKKDRPRRQIWTAKDVGLLYDAIATFTRKQHRRNNIPWKKLSVWMKERGATYEFAPASISKMWKTLQEDEQ